MGKKDLTERIAVIKPNGCCGDYRFKMYKMGLETLRLYENYGKPLTVNDRKRLQILVLYSTISHI